LLELGIGYNGSAMLLSTDIDSRHSHLVQTFSCYNRNGKSSTTERQKVFAS